MLNKSVNYILVLTVCVSCFFSKAVAQNTQAIAKLDPSTIRIGEQTKLHLTVEQLAKEQVKFPVLADTIIGKVQIVSVGKSDTIPDKNDHNKITVTKSYILTCFDAGTYTLPAFTFTTNAADGQKGVLKTAESILLVQSVQVDTTKAIYDIKQPLAVSYSFIDWVKDNWQWVILIIAGVLLIIGLIYYLIKRPKAEPAAKKPEPVLPAHTLALNKLTELHNKKLWQRNEVKQYYSELSEVMREYLEKRFHVKALEKTTDEISAGIKYLDIAAEKKNELYQLLVLADLVKFAKEKPLAEENERSIEQAIDFVLKTQIEVKAEQTEVKTEQNDLKAEQADLQNQAKNPQTDNSKNTEGGDTGEHI